MEKLENRNNVRVNNQVQILNLLRQGRKTVTELAEHLDISFTAASHIIDELVNEKLIKYSKKQSVNNRGRIPVFVEINCDSGVICGIDFSTQKVEVVLATLDAKIIAKDTIPNAMFITKELLLQIEDVIKELLTTPEVKNRPLLSICIASPGLIRPNNYEYADAYRVPDFTKINPVLFFANAFNVKTEMHNDVRIASLGELKYGSFPLEPFNGVFVHLGTGGGFSLIFNGKIYQGTNGFAGETPQYIGEDPVVKEAFWSGKLFAIWDIDRNIKQIKNLPVTNYSEEIDFDKIINDYNAKDEVTMKIVDESCKRNALSLINLFTILDVEYAVIEGPILKFGSQYVDNLKRYIEKYSRAEIRTRIVSSKLGPDCSLIGVCHQAISTYLFSQIEAITRKRINQPSFKINSAFKDI